MTRQTLIKRNPALTEQEFSEYWYTKHALLAIPLFLHCGASYYVQVHGPLHAEDPELSTTLSEWDGVGEIESTPPLIAAFIGDSSAPKWVAEYYREVVVPDERRLLVSEALKHVKPVEGGPVTGVRKVLIENGKCVVDVPETVWSVWRDYEKRGIAENKA